MDLRAGAEVEAHRLHDHERGAVGELLDVGGGEHAGVFGDDGFGGLRLRRRGILHYRRCVRSVVHPERGGVLSQCIL